MRRKKMPKAVGTQVKVKSVEFHVMKDWKCPECRTHNQPTENRPLKKMVTCRKCNEKFAVVFI